MKVSIVTVKWCEYVAPGSSVNWKAGEGSYLLAEAITAVEIEWKSCKTGMAPGQTVIGKRFQFVNCCDSEIAAVRGLEFKVEPQPGFGNCPLIFQQSNELTQSLLSMIPDGFVPDRKRLTMSKVLQPQLFKRLVPATLMQDTLSLKQSELSGQIDPRLIKVNRYIRTHFHRPLTLRDLADLIPCNPVYLSNTYSKVFQISPIKHLQQLKMDKARQLLLDTDWSVGEIAEQLGYVSGSQFADLFRRYYKRSPAAFRQHHRSEGRNEVKSDEGRR